MRKSRIAAYVSSLALAVACTVTGAATAQSSSEEAATGYVALGDSYSAGVGAGSYIGSSVDCLRSRRAYPVLWARAHSPSSFSFRACNGARTTDVLRSQLGPLSSRTGLVSITVGGSDAGFADVMTTCVLQGSHACLSAISRAHSYMDSTLPGNLDRLYGAISRKAPAAHVVVLGYPHLYKLKGDCVGGLSETVRSALNRAVNHLNAVTAKRAADHGFTFGDVRDTFSGHEICSGRPWLRSINLLAVTESYHPTATGQSHGYLPVFADAS
ncbi:SGNH/GDSL hydrolase family protein [Streptomyces sp. NPDC002896]|uniref:SGNH/GDSL hydrolase family protein n=1 Tax=Streptomyces sp. NPDC002896 TaxID=3154438 RepID=UPI003320F8A8